MRCCYPTGVHGNLIDNHFIYKEVCDVDILEARTQENKPLQIFCIKYPNYVMKIMVSWVTLYELEGAKTRRDFIDSSDMKETKLFKNQHLFVIHFKYRYQGYYHKNWRGSLVSLERTWTTKFWPDHNCA